MEITIGFDGMEFLYGLTILFVVVFKNEALWPKRTHMYHRMKKFKNLLLKVRLQREKKSNLEWLLSIIQYWFFVNTCICLFGSESFYSYSPSMCNNVAAPLFAFHELKSIFIILVQIKSCFVSVFNGLFSSSLVYFLENLTFVSL